MIDLLERFKENEIQNKDDLLYGFRLGLRLAAEAFSGL